MRIERANDLRSNLHVYSISFCRRSRSILNETLTGHKIPVFSLLRVTKSVGNAYQALKCHFACVSRTVTLELSSGKREK